MEMLRTRNTETKAILATMKVPVTELTTLDKPVALRFAELVSEMYIILLPHDLTKFIMEIRQLRILIGGMFRTNLNPLKSMINVNLPQSTLNLKEKGKRMEEE